MRISDWSSDVCSSDLTGRAASRARPCGGSDSRSPPRRMRSSPRVGHGMWQPLARAGRALEEALVRKLAVVVTLALLGARTALATPGGAAAELAGGQLFVASLEAGQEVPATDATGSGAASFAYDEAAGEVAFVLGTYDLTDVTAAHIHIGGPGENGPHVANLFGAVEDGVTRDGPLASATPADAYHGRASCRVEAGE